MCHCKNHLNKRDEFQWREAKGEDERKMIDKSKGEGGKGYLLRLLPIVTRGGPVCKWPHKRRR